MSREYVRTEFNREFESRISVIVHRFALSSLFVDWVLYPQRERGRKSVWQIVSNQRFVNDKLFWLLSGKISKCSCIHSYTCLFTPSALKRGSFGPFKTAAVLDNFWCWEQLIAALAAWRWAIFERTTGNQPRKSPGGYSREFFVGGRGAARYSKSWPYFRPKNVIFHTRYTLGTRGFSRVQREFSVLAEGAGHYKDLTETGNRARKVSGTRGIPVIRPL